MESMEKHFRNWECFSLLSLLPGVKYLRTYIRFLKGSFFMEALMKEKLNILPEAPGCYIYKDENGEILYIGKSKCLKKRVRSYFNKTQIGKTARLVRLINDLEYIVTDSEKEALLLEMSLIHTYKPPFNIQLKDGTSYPYIKITNEKNPIIEIVMEIKQDKAKYFGPYPNRYSARQTMELLQRLYPLCRCEGKLGRPCLYYQMGLCIGPCDHEVTPEMYQKQITKITQFLEGKASKVKQQLKVEMKRQIEALHFERAAELRDIILAIEETVEKQHIIFGDFSSRDIVGYSERNGYRSFHVFFVRNGAINGRKWGILPPDQQQSMEEAIIAFYQQPNNMLPKELLIPADLDQSYLKTALGIPIIVPKRGKKLEQVHLANENSSSALHAHAHLLEKFPNGLREAK